MQDTQRFFGAQASDLGADKSSDASPGTIHFAAVFGWSMAAVSAVMVAIVRMPLGSPHWFVFVKAFLLAAAIIACATVLTDRCIERRRSGYAPVLLLTLAVIFLPCLTLLIGRTVDIVALPLLLGITTFAVRTVVKDWRTEGSRVLLAIVCGCVAGAGYFIVVNSKGYATVLTPEQAVVGSQHLDTLFHSAIANMLLKHGALSFGLDGLTPIKYHVLSHIWLGSIGLWLGVPVMQAYYIGAQIVAIPVLLFSLALAFYLVRPPAARVGDRALVTLLPLLLLFVADAWGWTSYLVSESYFLALILLLLSLPLLAEIADDDFRFRPNLQLAALVLVGILMLIAKVSVGSIFWAGAGFLLWRQQGLTLVGLIKLAPPILLIVGLLGSVFSPDSSTYLRSGFRPFRFVVDYPHGAWPNIVADLVLLWAASKVWISGAGRDRKIAETFAILTIASLTPALSLDIFDTAYYFANVGTWACIVFVSAYANIIVGERYLYRLTPVVVILAILILALATDEKRGSLKKFATQFADLRTRVHVLNGESAGPDLTTRENLLGLLVPGHPARAALAEEVKRTPGARAEQTLLSTGLSQDRHAAVFVPPENAAFWNTYEDCRGDPLFVPATIGVPMIKGLNPSAAKCGLYSPPVYLPGANAAPSTDAQLCMRAARWKLTDLFVLENVDSARKIECSPK